MLYLILRSNSRYQVTDDYFGNVHSRMQRIEFKDRCLIVALKRS